MHIIKALLVSQIELCINVESVISFKNSWIRVLIKVGN